MSGEVVRISSPVVADHVGESKIRVGKVLLPQIVFIHAAGEAVAMNELVIRHILPQNVDSILMNGRLLIVNVSDVDDERLLRGDRDATLRSQCDSLLLQHLVRVSW